ncbi:tetratricopeptide repeat protein 4-like [Oculina patagonica]
MSDVTTPATQILDFDNETLKAIAEVYKNEGDSEYGNENCNDAIESYTQGIDVNCKDENLNAILFTKRATVHYHMGNYQKALNDADKAKQFLPTYTEAIEKGARACVRLNLFEDAIKWCEEGLQVSLKRLFSGTDLPQKLRTLNT